MGRPMTQGQIALDDIVRAIVDELKPSRSDCGAVQAAVSDAVILLRDTSRSFFDREAIRRNRDEARGIIRTIDELQDQIEHSSPEMRLRLKLDFPLLGNPEREQGTARLLSELNDLRKICEEADRNQPRGDRIKEWCALSGWELVWRLKPKSELEMKTGVTGPERVTLALLYTIAGLLYEAVAPERVREWRNTHEGEAPDLRTACNAVHHTHISALSEFLAEISSEI
jgi:hypothetical protein